MRTLEALRHRIESLPPYASLLLIGVPLAVVEPLKLAIVFIAGDGHWLGGGIAMICAYAVSLFITHWLFGVVKPKLMKLSWFAAAWNWFCAMRDKVWGRPRGPSVRRAK
jgi:hypothetical protein